MGGQLGCWAAAAIGCVHNVRWACVGAYLAISVRKTDDCAATYAKQRTSLKQERGGGITCDILRCLSNASQNQQTDHVGVWVVHKRSDFIRGYTRQPQIREHPSPPSPQPSSATRYQPLIGAKSICDHCDLGLAQYDHVHMHGGRAFWSELLISFGGSASSH